MLRVDDDVLERVRLWNSYPKEFTYKIFTYHDNIENSDTKRIHDTKNGCFQWDFTAALVVINTET